MTNLIKTTFSNFSILYKNFLHWNILKILINIFPILLGLLLALPFFWIFFWFVYFDPINWQEIIWSYVNTKSIWLSFLTAVTSHFFYVLVEVLLLVISIWLFLFWYSYRVVLFSKINMDYVSFKKTPYFSKNIYFDFKYIFKYLSIVSWTWLILLIPFLIFLILMRVYVFSFWWVDEIYKTMLQSQINTFSTVSLVTFLILVLVFVYLSYRLSYSYILILDENKDELKDKTWLYFVKKSFEITSWIKKLFKFLVLLILFSIFMYIISFIWEKLEDFWNLAKIIYTIVVFLFINWLFEMLIVTTYYEIMIKEDNSLAEENIN